jgi:ABC-type ATPase involved in cell division
MVNKITLPQQIKPNTTNNISDTYLIQQTVTQNVNLTTALTQEHKVNLTKEVVEQVVEVVDNKDAKDKLTPAQLKELEEREAVIIASIVVFILAIFYKITK